jgi:glycosyltransferase involved in cell wall biosynthesis
MFTGMLALRRKLRSLSPQLLVSAGNHAHQTLFFASSRLPHVRRILRISNEIDHYGDGPLARMWRRSLRRFIYARADRLLLVSSHLTRDPLLAEAVSKGRALITPNGVDVEQVRLRARMPYLHPMLSQSTPYIVAMGRLVPHKNFSTLIRAFARAAASRPLKMLIIGGGPRGHREELEELAAQLGVADSVRLEGQLDNPMPLVARAAAFVLPSLWEGGSNALLEALACDVPIVASRSAGNAQEVLGYGRFGLLVDPLDVNGMAQAILYQVSADARRPGTRAADYAADAAIARVCQAIVELAAPAGVGGTRTILPGGP